MRLKQGGTICSANRLRNTAPGKRLGAFGMVVLAVAPGKGLVRAGHLDDAGIGDGHPVGVTPQILHHALGRTKGLLGIHRPRVLDQVAGHGFFDFAQPLELAQL